MIVIIYLFYVYTLAREGHSSVLLSMDIFIIGGRGGTDYNGNYDPLNDVWKSSDRGITWTPQTTNGGFPGKHSI